MRAVTARRMAKSVNSGVKTGKQQTPHEIELEIILIHIQFEASKGSFVNDFHQDMINENETAKALETLGYAVEYIQHRPTSRPFWRVSWERKAA